MRLDSRDGLRGTLYDTEKQCRIPKPVWFDEETGEFEAFRVDAAERIVFQAGTPIKYKAHGKLKFVPRTVKPKIEIQKPIVPGNFGAATIARATGGFFCEHPTCVRTAEWQTCDEILMPPVDYEGHKYEAAKYVITHYWCSWHYQEPFLYIDKDRVKHKIEFARPQ